MGTMLAYGSLPASVIIISWRKIPGQRISFTDALEYSTIFHLPRHSHRHKFVHRDTLYATRNEIGCEHNTTRYDNAPDGTPFFDAGSQPPLITLDLAITPIYDGEFVDIRSDPGKWVRVAAETTPLQFVIPGRALTSRITMLDAAAGGAKGMRAVPWCDWGEDTRTWDRRLTQARLYGSRLLCLEDSADPQVSKVVIYDFDSPESMVRDIRSSDKTHLNEIVVEPLHLHPFSRRNLREPVITRAPYRRLESNVEVSSYATCALFGENCFVLLDKSANR